MHTHFPKIFSHIITFVVDCKLLQEMQITKRNANNDTHFPRHAHAQCTRLTCSESSYSTAEPMLHARDEQTQEKWRQALTANIQRISHSFTAPLTADISSIKMQLNIGVL